MVIGFSWPMRFSHGTVMAFEQLCVHSTLSKCVVKIEQCGFGHIASVPWVGHGLYDSDGSLYLPLHSGCFQVTMAV